MQNLLVALQNFEYRAAIMRLMFAFVAGAIIGLNRGLKRRGAGIKTHVLVCCSSALVMMTGEYINLRFNGAGDVARLGAQVISGVGFLGVGTIIVTGRNQIKGLTTAATLWTSACMGLAIGIGFYSGALILGVLVILDLTVVTKIDTYILEHSRIIDLYIEFPDVKSMSEFVSMMREEHVDLQFSEMCKVHIKGAGIATIATVKLRQRKDRDRVIDLIRSANEVRFVQTM